MHAEQGFPVQRQPEVRLADLPAAFGIERQRHRRLAFQDQAGVLGPQGGEPAAPALRLRPAAPESQV